MALLPAFACPFCWREWGPAVQATQATVRADTSVSLHSWIHLCPGVGLQLWCRVGGISPGWKERDGLVFTFTPFPMPFVQGHRFTGRREEEGADLHCHPAPPKVFRSIPKPPPQTFQPPAPLSPLPSLPSPQAFPIPGPRYLSPPSDTSLSCLYLCA